MDLTSRKRGETLKWSKCRRSELLARLCVEATWKQLRYNGTLVYPQLMNAMTFHIPANNSIETSQHSHRTNLGWSSRVFKTGAQLANVLWR